MSEHTENHMNDPVEQLRLQALAKVRVGEVEEALTMYDVAYEQTSDEAVLELITINKADAMIALGRSGREVTALPAIVMRRRSLRHTFLASYALVFKYRTEKELKRATFYGKIALQAAEEANEPLWNIGALNELATIHDIDSKFDEAIACSERAVQLSEQLEDAADRRFLSGLSLENLGASKLLNDQFDAGVADIEHALPLITSPTHRAEAYIDLCFGYSSLEQLDRARRCGDTGLELATESRQVRNAHYLLGEVAFKSGDTDLAEYHFDELAKFYPDFQHLKPLLYALDLRSMVNLKL